MQTLTTFENSKDDTPRAKLVREFVKGKLDFAYRVGQNTIDIIFSDVPGIDGFNFSRYRLDDLVQGKIDLDTNRPSLRGLNAAIFLQLEEINLQSRVASYFYGQNRILMEQNLFLQQQLQAATGLVYLLAKNSFQRF